ncbi:MAG: DUF4249 domain-containing protein [Chryseosolibacter sp.]
MLKKLKFLPLFLLIAGCIEPYEFVIRDASPSLVIEAYISDRSFNETLSYPSDGRYFTVKLTETGDVTNSRPKPVNGAIVELLTSKGESFFYNPTDEGLYKLVNADFSAETGVEYKLRVSLADETIYESGWEALPETEIPPMGEIGFAEGEKQVYVMEAMQWVLRTKKIVTANIRVAENANRETIYYRWSYSPMWIYFAPLSSSIDPGNKCWATDGNYLNSYTLQTDRAGGYVKDLFFMQTIRNERIFDQLSVLVLQHATTESFYYFWKEMQDQNEGSALLDTPPYNLKTNFESRTGERRVSGYFGVVKEQAKRWYFNRKDLSYNVVHTLRADCLVDYGPGGPAPECLDCREYSFGKATTVEPSWWME